MAGVVPEVLVWELIKNHNNALVKNKGKGDHFSRERFNLLNKHTFKHSGYARRSAIDITDNKKTVGLTVKNTRTAKPGKQVHREVNKPFRAGAVAVRNAVKQSGRNTLLDAALARFSRVKRSQKPKPPAGVKKPNHPRRLEKAKLRKDPHLV